jgi:phenylacetate-coenzyme A ligase PaaK-like adenylate-forming protein
MSLPRFAWNAYLAYHLRGQVRLPFRPLAVIEHRQSRRVQSMVSHAYRTVPYYRGVMDRLGLGPSDFQGAADLPKLPLLERTQLQRDPEAFVSTVHRLHRCLKLRTGGSTGMPCTIYHDTAALFQNAAQGERERAMLTPLVGRSFGYRETVIGSPTTTDKVVQEFCQARGFFPPILRIRRQYLSLLDPPGTNLARINEFQPDVIRSYGSYLELLFPYIHATGRPFSRPKCVTYSSDSLSHSVRQLITETFGVPVLSTYEAVEAFKIGFECHQRVGVHLNVDLYPVRIVNAQGEPLPDGASGDVVVSNLVNRATVLLNYRLGDLATKLPGPCPCGRQLPLLSLPQGRNDEYPHLTGGRVMHPQSVRTILLAEEAVWQFQVVQETPTSLRVALVAADSADCRRISKRLAAKFAALFGPEITVEMAFVESIDRTATGGKFRVVVSLSHKSVGAAPQRRR